MRVFYRYVEEYPSHNRHMAIYGNTASSAKPEVHNVLRRHQRRTEPQSHAKCRKFEVRPCGFRVVRADRQRDRHTHRNNSHPSIRADKNQPVIHSLLGRIACTQCIDAAYCYFPSTMANVSLRCEQLRLKRVLSTDTKFSQSTLGRARRSRTTTQQSPH